MSSPQNHPAAPAFTALLDAYTRWQYFEEMPAPDTPSLSNVPGHDEHAHLSAPISASLAFIMTCPYIDVADLPEDERNCPICLDPYHRLSDRARDLDLKVAQRLPCGHYLCNHCLFKWLDPFEQSNNNTCPFDRRVLFPKFPHSLNTEGIQARIDLVDWFNEARGRQPLGAERDATRDLKARLVERRLGEAVEEWDADRFQAHTLMMQSRTGTRGMDVAVLSAYHGKLLLFEHRLTTIGAIAVSLQGSMPMPTLQARLQRMTERLARDRTNVQETRDVMHELGEGGIAALGEGRGIDEE